MNTYPIGSLVGLDYVIRDPVTLVPEDPTYLLCIVEDPTGYETSYAYGTATNFLKNGIGDYTNNVDADKEGLWKYRFRASGTVITADDAYFFCRAAYV